MVKNTLINEKTLREQVLQANATINNLNLQLEDKVVERTTALEEALTAKTEFINNISHEMRTPIQGVVSIAEGLVKHWKEFSQDKRLQLATQVESNAKRLLSLISNLLDVSKFAVGKIQLNLQKIALSDLVQEIIDECNSLYLSGKNIQLKFNCSETHWVIADRERISQVLRNLFTNAIKFSPNNTVIVAKLCLAEATYDDGFKSQAVHFTLTDQGIGVPEGEEDRIFAPFVQSSTTKIGGTGLGLAICRDVIKAHHGRIWVRNNEKSGAAFNFIIPTTQAKQMDGRHVIVERVISDAATADCNNAPAHVVIIDDEEACLISMELLLHGTSYSLTKISSGIEGLQFLQQHHQTVDVVLLDLMMPDIYGLNLLSELKKDPNLARIPIILQSGTSDESEIAKALLMGVTTFIRKPYMRQDILSQIALALAKPS